MSTMQISRQSVSDHLGGRARLTRRSLAGAVITLALALSSTALLAQDTTVTRKADSTARAADTSARQDSSNRVSDTTARAADSSADSTRGRPALGPGGTHTVTKGETLWTIARTYFGDPFMWPEIYRVNTASVEDPHWIFPGEVLTIPVQQTVLASAQGAQPAAAPAVTPTPAALEAPTTPVAATPDTDIIVEQVVAAGPTVFRRHDRHIAGRGIELGTGITVQQPAPLVRAGEYYAAPFVERNGGPRDAGHIIASSEVPGIALAGDRTEVQPHERVYVTPPVGRVYGVGDELLVYKLGDELDGIGQVVIPTGVLRVLRPDHGDAPVAELERTFGRVKLGQLVMPLDTLILPDNVHPEPVDLGVEARIVWIQDQAVLPSLQSYVIFNTTSREGVHLGDQFTIMRPRVRTEDGYFLPEEPIALAQVVRVTRYGVTAIVVDQRHPAIKEGSFARVTAKMP